MQICFKTISQPCKTALSRTHAKQYGREIKTFILYYCRYYYFYYYCCHVAVVDKLIGCNLLTAERLLQKI